MVEAVLGDPPRPNHQEILEEEQTQLYHDHDGLPKCCRIVEIVQADIDKGVFPDGSKVRRLLDAITREARKELMYRRQHHMNMDRGGRGVVV